MFWFFGHKACGILAPQPGIEPVLPAFEGKVFNHWTAREVLESALLTTVIWGGGKWRA